MTGLFWGLLLALAVQRLAETRVARRHERALLARGGQRVPNDLYPTIIVMHSGFFASCALEYVLSSFAGTQLRTWPLLGVFAAGQALRIWAIRTLGDRWTTRVYIVPGERPVTSGPYRWIRHPNYAGVALELAAFPLAFGLTFTSIVFSVLNAAVLLRRIGIEERALSAVSP